MLISIKIAVVPYISLAIVIALGIFIYNIFSKKGKRVFIVLAGATVLLLFGLVVLMNLKNDKGEYVWKSVNQGETKHP